MAFRALLFSKNTESNSALTAACKTAGVRPEICSDIFSAIEKGKTRTFSCIIVDWADQPEASFLLKRARESAANRETVAIAIVNGDLKPSEQHDSRLDFLIYRPVTPDAATLVLTEACEKMKPLDAEDARESFQQVPEASAAGHASDSHAGHQQPSDPPSDLQTNSLASDEIDNAFGAPINPELLGTKRPSSFRTVMAGVLSLAGLFLLWSSRDHIKYLATAPEGGFHIIRQSVAALFYLDKTAPPPVAAAGGDAQQDAYFRRGPTPVEQSAPLRVAPTESTLVQEARLPLPKAPDFPLPRPTLENQEAPPVRVRRAAIPDSMRNSEPIERPLVVAVNPALLPVSTPPSPTQPSVQRQISEPVMVTEQAQRALLIHSVDPVYPPEALSQKLQGPVILQAVIGRDGSVQDLKIVRGYFALGKAAIAAVKQWRFQPYNFNGHPAATQTVITVDFASPRS